MDGVIRFAAATEHLMRITFDDGRTDRQKITEALLKGGVVISGIAAPAPAKPPSYDQ